MQWIYNLIEKITAFIPRLWFIYPDEQGIRVTLGKYVSNIGPGWYIYWPLIQQITKLTVTPQVPDVRPQSVLTRDGHSFTLSVAIKYRIRDARRAILNVQDFDTNLEALACGVCIRYVSERSIDELNDIAAIEDYIKRALQSEARGWGLDILSCYVTDIGATFNLRLLSGQIDNR